MSPSTNSVRTLCLLAFAVLFGTAAVAQSSASSPTPALSSPVPSSVATPSPSPATEAAQPGASAEYPKLSYPDLLPRFDYDSHTGLDMRQTNVEKRGGVRLIELNYAGAGGDRVPAYLLIPPGKGPFAGII